MLLHNVILFDRIDDIVILEATKHVEEIVILSCTSAMISSRVSHVFDRSPTIHLNGIFLYAT